MAEEGVEAMDSRPDVPRRNRLDRRQGTMERFRGNVDYMYIETGFFG